MKLPESPQPIRREVPMTTPLLVILYNEKLVWSRFLEEPPGKFFSRLHVR